MNRIFSALPAVSLVLGACTYEVHGTDSERSVEAAGMMASRDVDVPGDAEFSGMVVDAGGRVGRNLHLAGATVTSDASVGGNLYAEGGRVRFTGNVGGDAEIAAGTGFVDAEIGGDVQVAAGRIELDGRIGGRLSMDGGHMELLADVMGPVDIRGDGRDHGRNGRLELRGNLHQGGRICASEVEISGGAQIDGDLLVIAEDRPRGDGFRYEPLNGRSCDRL